MLDNKVTAYEGPEPYIFISYAHKDTDKVFPILEHLQSRGYRIWYDDGIAPGSEWPENIAQHLNDCAMTMAFISPNSMASPNCRREINFALSKQKPFLSVVLEPTQMPLGMELQLSAQQSVIRYNYRSDAKFIEKICSCPDLACCREKPAEPEPVPVPVAVPAAPETAVAAPEKTPEQPKKTLFPAKKPATPKEKPSRAKAPKKSKKILAIVGAALALLAAIILIGSATSKIEITPDKTIDKNDTSLYLRDMTVTSDTIAQLSKMKKLESLSFSNCQFEAGALEGWQPASPIEHFTMENCTGSIDLQFLTQCPALTILQLPGSGITDDVMPTLTQEGLYQIDLSGNPELTDLTKLSGLPGLMYVTIDETGVKELGAVATEKLYEISFRSTPISDVTPLANCQNLSEIVGSYSTVTDITPLAALTDLSVLKFYGCDLSGMNMDVSFQSLRLNTLSLGYTGITSLKPFENMTRLVGVYVDGNELDNEDLRFLEKSAETLKYLDISFTLFSATTGSDNTWIAACTNLVKLYMDGTRADHLNFVDKMAGLTYIEANACGLRDISGLAGCPELTEILLARNEFTALDALSLLLVEDSDYARFDFTGCSELTDISCLPPIKYSRLCLAGCPNVDFTNMSGITGNYITLTYNDTFQGSYMDTDPFNTYYITDCPDDLKVSIEDTLGGYGVTFGDMGWGLINEMEFQLDIYCDYLRCPSCAGSGKSDSGQPCIPCAGSGLY